MTNVFSILVFFITFSIEFLFVFFALWESSEFGIVFSELENEGLMKYFIFYHSLYLFSIIFFGFIGFEYTNFRVKKILKESEKT